MPNDFSGSIISSRIFENLKFLKRICRCQSEKSRWKLLRKASFEELLAIVEVCANLRRPNAFYLTKRQKERVSPFASNLRALSRVRSPASARRFTIQKGSGPFFAAILAPIIAEAGRYLVSRLADGQ